MSYSEFVLKQNLSFINNALLFFVTIILCPKRVHGILLIKSYIIKRFK